MRLQHRTALVTGGADGIGRGIAERFAREGARVFIADIAERTQAVAAELSSATGGTVIGVVADASFQDQVDRVWGVVDGAGCVVDTLVNNAGTELTRPMIDTEEDDWDRILRINLKSVYLHSRQAIRRWTDAGRGGVILNLGSITAKVGFANYPAYTASKGAIHALTRQMAMELSPQRIRVNTLYPGTIKTPLAMRNYAAAGGDLEATMAAAAEMHLVGRLGEVEDVAHLAVYLGSEESSFVTGQEFGVDGGFEIRGT